MNSKTILFGFLENFFSRLEQFPPAPGIVTYDRMNVRFHHPGARLFIRGVTALARCYENSERIHLRLVFELGDGEEMQKPIQLDVKDSFYSPRQREQVRQNLSRMVGQVLEGFAPSASANHSQPASAGNRA